jgi:hypothetical protein
MTVNSATNTIPYPLASGTSTVGLVYTFPFRIFLNTDLAVTALNANSGVNSTLALGTDYTVTGMGAYAGGSITLLTDWEGTTLSISRVEPVTQLTSFASQGAFFPEMHEAAFDKLTMIMQWFQTKLGLALQIPLAFLGTVSGALPVPAAGQVLGWNATATGLQNYVAGSGSATALQGLLADPTMAVNGSGMIGHNDALAYAAGTAGYAIKQRTTLTAVAAFIVAQTAQAYVTGGTGSAYTLTPTPALAANAQWVRYHCEFWAAGVGSPTMAVSGLPALPLMAYNSAGVLVPYLPAVGQFSDIECDGTNWIVLDPLAPKGVQTGPPENLIVTYAQNSGIVTVTCSAVTVSDANGNQTRLTASQYPALANGTLQANLATINAINGTDGSTLTVGNMFVTFITFNPTTNSIGLVISAEPTSATTPVVAPANPISGYTQHKPVSANKIKAAGVWLPGVQNGMEFTPQVGAYLTALVPFVSGTIGTWSTGVGVAERVRGNGSLIPYHAGGVTIASWCQGVGCAVNISPNSNCGAPNSITNPPLFSVDNSSTAFPCVLSHKFNLESDFLYVSSVNTYTFLAGWTINF